MSIENVERVANSVSYVLNYFFAPPKKYSRYIISSGGVNKLYVLGLGPCTIIAVKMKTI